VPAGAGDQDVANDALNCRRRESGGTPAAAGLQAAEEGIENRRFAISRLTRVVIVAFCRSAGGCRGRHTLPIAFQYVKWYTPMRNQ